MPLDTPKTDTMPKAKPLSIPPGGTVNLREADSLKIRNDSLQAVKIMPGPGWNEEDSVTPPLPPKPPLSPEPSLSQTHDSLPRFGIRVGYGLEFPSKNTVGLEDVRFFEAGHRLNYGAFVDIPIDSKTRFALFAGLENQFWPKSQSYVPDCSLDSFPTFMSTADSLPGRDHRLVSLLMEPSLRFSLRPKGLSFRVLISAAYVIQSRVEEYTHTCNATPFLNWRTYTEDEFRKMSKLNVGLGFNLVKTVNINPTSGFLIECGPRFMLSSLFSVRDPLIPDRAFTLSPWGFQLNIGFFR